MKIQEIKSPVQKAIIRSLIDSQEKERLRVGKELQENINQHLLAVKLHLEIANENTSGRAMEMIGKACDDLFIVISEIRGLSQSLLPLSLNDIGLIESIRDTCDELERRHGFHVEFSHRYFPEDKLTADMKLMLFRIFQQLVDNITRHACASDVFLQLLADAEQIDFSISDNGIGFDPTLVKPGHGLANMIARVNLFQGKTKIESSVGRGCSVIISLPLECSKLP